MSTMPTAGDPGRNDATAVPTLVVRSVPLAGAQPLTSLLPALDAAQLLSWVRRGEGLVAWGEALSLHTSGPERFAEADQWWRRVCAAAVVRDDILLAGSGLVCFGSFAFADGSAHSSRLVIPSVVVGRRGGRTWVTTITADPQITPIDAPEAGLPATCPGDVAFADGALSPAQWAHAVSEAVERIGAGGIEKVVLARDLVATATEPIDARWVLTRLADRYENTWVFAVCGLLGATPELLVRRDHRLVTSRVLAGTIRRSGNDEKDLALAASLARSSKDLEEHEYAVRSVADALALHCSSMNVPESPFVLHLPNVMHLATDVAGVTDDDTSALALAASLHPSAAIGGTPTERAVAVIAELEHMDRGRYAGPVGWMDSRGDGEWGIALRCGQIHEKDPRSIRLFAGCGIVAGSVPDAEVAESDAKLVPMRDALGQD